jgi:hypothetical protein
VPPPALHDRNVGDCPDEWQLDAAIPTSRHTAS